MLKNLPYDRYKIAIECYLNVRVSLVSHHEPDNLARSRSRLVPVPCSHTTTTLPVHIPLKRGVVPKGQPVQHLFPGQ